MIDKETLIYDILKENPGSEEILVKFGMHCLGCPASRAETLEQAAAAHGIELDALIKALNEFKAE